MDECFSSQTKPSLFRVPQNLRVHLLRNKVSVNRGERQAKEMQLSCQLCKRVRKTRCCRFYVDGEERDKRRRHKRRVFSRASASSYAHRTISTQINMRTERYAHRTISTQNTYAHRTLRTQNKKHAGHICA